MKNLTIFLVVKFPPVYVNRYGGDGMTHKENCPSNSYFLIKER